MRHNLPPWCRESRCHLHTPAAPLHVITNNYKHVGPTINEKNQRLIDPNNNNNHNYTYHNT
ncbi:hypothetical protein BHM03_00011266 [Ensete ventricosum]|nr:hypothetical protein BHM03_00011266 [Ensete ventricosum]